MPLASSWVDARGAAKHPVKHRTSPRPKHNGLTNVSRAEAEKVALPFDFCLARVLV